MFERDGFKFDFQTQRFIQNRWETDLGRKVLMEVIWGLQNSLEVRAILDDYTLDHPENYDPYAHPIYPKDAMRKDEFWVLTNDDLRGVHIYHEDFSNSPSIERKSLSYSRFFKCRFNNADFSVPDISYAQFEDCEFIEAKMIRTGGFSTRFINCNMQNACMWNSTFIDSDFSGSDLRGAYFEDAFLRDIHLNYLTKFDRNLRMKWSKRTLPPEQIPEILRNIRIAYEKAELWHISDTFLYAERTENRRRLIWPSFKRTHKLPDLLRWSKDLLYSALTGYATKPHRVIFTGMLISLIFAGFYFLFGTPSNLSDKWASVFESLYFSFTTFATLGYGDISYSSDREIMRLLSTGEAWLGAVVISLFVAVLARKLLR
jgi:hypothetical protein